MTTLNPLTVEEVGHQHRGEGIEDALVGTLAEGCGIPSQWQGPFSWLVFAVNGLTAPLRSRGIFRWHGMILDTLRAQDVDFEPHAPSVHYRLEPSQDLSYNDYVLLPQWNGYYPLTLAGRVQECAIRANQQCDARGLFLICAAVITEQQPVGGLVKVEPKPVVVGIGPTEIVHSPELGRLIPVRRPKLEPPLCLIARKLPA